MPAEVAVVDLVNITVWYRPEGGEEQLEGTREYEAFILRKSGDKRGYTVARIPLGPAEAINTATAQWLTLIEETRGLTEEDRQVTRVADKTIVEDGLP